MLTSNSIISHYWAFAIFIIFSIGLCCLMLIGGSLLGGRSKEKYKDIPFESGVNPVGSARLCLSIKFYLIAMLFVIFDVEGLYLFLWSVSIQENGWLGFFEFAIFIAILLVSLIYLMRIGALDWTPAPSRGKYINRIGINFPSVNHYKEN